MDSKRATSLLALLFALTLNLHAQDDGLGLLPQPKQVKRAEGKFVIGKGVRIVAPAAIAEANKNAIAMLKEEIATASGQKIASGASASGLRSIRLRRLKEADFPALDAKVLPRFREEGYVLEVTTRGVVVAAPSDVGIFYGVQTLRQLVRPAGKTAEVPAVRIVDWPTMQWRGVHDDISRGPMPTMDYMKKQIRTLAEYKVNMFSLYLEHMFAFKQHPVASPAESAITAEDIRELVEYAKGYHVTLLPEQQAFGHLHHVLKFEKYSDVAETPHGHVLSPVNERSYQLIKEMYAELIPLFPGELFHIGADETWELGTGQTKAHAAEVGLGRVYLEHLTKVNEILKPYDKRLMFWADIAQSFPDLLKILPKDAIAVAWAYDPRPAFDEKLKPFHDAGLALFVAPGANNWNRIVPNYDAAYVNTRNFIRDGQKYNAIGVLNTTWDDDGDALFEMTWPPLIYGAAASWQGGESSIEDFAKKYDWAFYRNGENTAFHDAVKNIGKAHALLQSVQLGGASTDSFWLDPFTKNGARYVQRALPVAKEMRLSAENGFELIARNRKHAKLHAETLNALELAALRVDYHGMKVQMADEVTKHYLDAFQNPTDNRRVSRNLSEISGINARLEDLRDGALRIRDLYSKQWMAENKPYWLGSVTVRFDILARGFQEKIYAIKQARGTFRETKALPEPESLGFFAPAAPPAVVEAPKPVSQPN